MNLVDWWYGAVGLSLWTTLIYTLVVTHVTIVSVTVYLHRHSAHRALDLKPGLALFFRAWLWLTTGMITKEWTAVHRKHHATTETEDDPHSPASTWPERDFLERHRILSRRRHAGGIGQVRQGHTRRLV